MNRILFVALIVGFLASKNAFACSCNGPLTSSFHENAHEVFVGTVTSKKTNDWADREFSFDVSEVVRGKLPRKIVIHSRYLSASCGRTYQVGTEYIVRIHRENEKLYSGLCSSWSMTTELGKTVYEFLTILNEVAEPLTSSKTSAHPVRSDAAKTRRPF